MSLHAVTHLKISENSVNQRIFILVESGQLVIRKAGRVSCFCVRCVERMTDGHCRRTV